ncbi:hypothetical protein D9M69_470560 [compost metagenome]
MVDGALIVLGAMVRARLQVSQFVVATAGGAGQDDVAGRAQVAQRLGECPQAALPTMGVQVAVLGRNDSFATLLLSLHGEGIERIAQVKQVLAAFNLLVGPLEQDAEHIIGDQQCLVVLLVVGTGAGESRHRPRGSIGPRILWHPVIGVLAKLMERFDGSKAATQPILRQRLALVPVRLACLHIGLADQGCHRAQVAEFERLQVAQEWPCIGETLSQHLAFRPTRPTTPTP